MIQGMTGFGHADFTCGKIKGSAEIKSVNHRYLDVAYYLPLGFAKVEEKLRILFKQNLERGRINVSLKITSKPEPQVSFNHQVAKTYIRKSAKLKRELGLSGQLSLPELIQLPGVVVTSEWSISVEKIWPNVETCIKKALSHMTAMRKREGISLAADIRDKLRRMTARIRKINRRTKAIFKEKKENLTPEEFLSFQKGVDINEEVSRLTHHVEECRLLLRTKGSVGKKLDFVAQEMQRETNTIGSKLQDKLIANEVVGLKSKIEKLREQAQNIE